MCDQCFRDRRPHAAPGEGDFLTPMNRTEVARANDRVRAATPAYHLDGRNTQLSTLAVQRHRARQAGRGDFESVGHYLEFVTGADS